MPETRRKYDEEFREGAVRIVRETGSRLPRSLVTSGSTRARWGTGSPRTGPSGARQDGALSADERARLRELEREVAELRMERDVLKRSVVLWVKEATR